MNEKDIARFEVKVNRAEGCWLWTSSKNHKGYGLFRVNGKYRIAHRVAYALINGPIPEGMVVMHLCDTPACCNPTHLRLGTVQDNNADKVSKGRQARLTGTSNGSAKLSEDQARECLDRKARGDRAQDIARSFGVHPSTISLLLSGRAWPHLSRGAG